MLKQGGEAGGSAIRRRNGKSRSKRSVWCSRVREDHMGGGGERCLHII